MSGRGFKRPAQGGFGPPGFKKRRGFGGPLPPPNLMDPGFDPYMWGGPGGPPGPPRGQFDQFGDFGCGGYNDFDDYTGGYAGPNDGGFEGELDFASDAPPMGPPPPPMRGRMLAGRRSRFGRMMFGMTRGRFFNPGFGPFRGRGFLRGRPRPPFMFPPMRGRGRGRPRGGGGNKNDDSDDEANPEDMSIAEKIRRFCLFLQNDQPKSNAIQTIENAVTACKLNLRTLYDTEELMKVGGRCMYTGSLSISGVFLHRSVAANKKELKHEVYKKAVEILASKSIVEIFSLQDVGVDDIRTELKTSIDEKHALKMKEEEEEAAALSSTTDPLEGIKKLQEFLTSVSDAKKIPEQKVSCLEQAVTASKCGLLRKYEPEVLRLPNGKVYFRGTFYLHNIPIATGQGPRKKDAKTECFNEAMNALLEKNPNELVKGISLEFERDSESLIKGHVPVEITGVLSLEEKFAEFIKFVQESSTKDNQIVTLDVTAVNIGLLPTCIYKRVKTGGQHLLTCDLYLDNILIASGESDKRRLSQKEAYANAWELLQTATPQTLMNEHKKMTAEDKDGSDVFDVVIKGWAKTADSNLAGLRRNHYDMVDSEGLSPSTMVIIEHDSWSIDRQKHAFCILNYSCTQNGMLMEWKWESSPGNMFKCTISIQKQKIGESIASNKNTAKNLAAADALFKLYETNDVFKVTVNKAQDSGKWITWEEISKKMERLKITGGTVYKYLTDKIKTEEPEEKEEVPLDPYCLTVCKKIVDDFSMKETLDDLIFGPGMPHPERREVSQYIRTNQNLKVENRFLEGESYFVTSRKYSPQKMLEFLKNPGKHHGKISKYEVVPRDQLPKHESIEADLEKSKSYISFPPNKKTATSVVFPPPSNGTTSTDTEEKMET